MKKKYHVIVSMLAVMVCLLFATQALASQVYKAPQDLEKPASREEIERKIGQVKPIKPVEGEVKLGRIMPVELDYVLVGGDDDCAPYGVCAQWIIYDSFNTSIPVRLPSDSQEVKTMWLKDLDNDGNIEDIYGVTQGKEIYQEIWLSSYACFQQLLSEYVLARDNNQVQMGDDGRKSFKTSATGERVIVKFWPNYLSIKPTISRCSIILFNNSPYYP